MTRKITADMEAGGTEPVLLANLDAKRDWGFAGDYVDGMWRMLQQERCADFVLATGETRTVREFAEKAAAALDFELVWRGEGVDEEGIDARTGKRLIGINTRYFWPAEVEVLMGDPAAAEKQLGWRCKVDFPMLVDMMAQADRERVKAGRQRQ